MEPFFTPYPFVSTKDRDSDEFDVREGFFAQYILKAQPLTRGQYEIRIEPPAGAKVCKVVITHVGENMPCTEAPGPVLTTYENTEIVYNDGGLPADANKCGKNAVVRFKDLTNWGTDPIVTDLTPDGDSIQVVAYMQTCLGAPAGAFQIPYTLAYGTATSTGNFEITLTADTKAPVTDVSFDGLTTYKSLVGPNGTIYRGATKLMQFDVVVPKDYFGGLALNLKNVDYASGVPVELCGFALVAAGENLPCLNLVDDVTVENGTDVFDLGDG